MTNEMGLSGLRVWLIEILLIAPTAVRIVLLYDGRGP